MKNSACFTSFCATVLVAGAASAIPYEHVDRNYVVRMENQMSADEIPGPLKPGSCLVYKTSAGRYGKLKVVGYESSGAYSFYNLKIAYTTFDASGRVFSSSASTTIKGTWPLDLDSGTCTAKHDNGGFHWNEDDIWWEIENKSGRKLCPLGKAVFARLPDGNAMPPTSRPASDQNVETPGKAKAIPPPASTQTLKRMGKTTPKGWTDDFASALEAGRESGRPLFILFDGTENLQALHQGWLANPKFVSEAGKRYVLVYLDISLVFGKSGNNPLRDQFMRVAKLLNTDHGCPQFHIMEPDDSFDRLSDGKGSPQRLISDRVWLSERNGEVVRLPVFNPQERATRISYRFRLSLVRDHYSMEGWLDWLARIADALSYVRNAEKEIGALDDKDSDEAVKIMRDALVMIDEETLGNCFVEDAEKVVAHNSAYLEDFPYLRFVEPLRKDFETLRTEFGWFASDQKNEKKAFAQGNYKAKYTDLLDRLAVARSEAVGHPQTIQSLDRLEAEIKKEISRHTK